MIEFMIANKADIQELTNIRIEYMDEAFNIISDDDRKRLNVELPIFFKKNLGDKCVAFVAKDNETIVACALLIIIEKPNSPVLKSGLVGEAMGVFTKPKYRNQGIATTLMRNMIQFAEIRGFDRIDLDASANGAGVYRKVGFNEKQTEYISMRISL